MHTSRPAGWRPPISILAIGLALALGGCAAVGPNYAEPAPAASSAWQAPLAHSGKVAALGDWWSQFNDPVLTRLQRSAESGSPTLAKAWANIEPNRS